MDIEKLEKTAKSKLEELIKKYNIKETLSELIYHYSSVYIHKDYKQKRIRLLGIKEDYVVDKNGDKHRTGKKKTVQLYVLSKRMIQTLPKDSVFEISRDLSEFAYHFTVLNQIEKLKSIVGTKSFVTGLNSMNTTEYERLKE